MELNSKINKATAIIVPAGVMVLYVIAFCVLDKTSITITAFVAGIVAALLFMLGNLYFLTTERQYPWTAAIPMTLWRYLITSTLLSAVFVIVEKFVAGFSLPVIVLIIGHILIFAFYVVMLLLMHSGKKYIEKIDENMVTKRQFVKDISSQLNAIFCSVPEANKDDIKAVIDAVKYSDPMSVAEASAIEKEIEAKTLRLANLTDYSEINTLCTAILSDIRQRNQLVRNNRYSKCTGIG